MDDLERRRLYLKGDFSSKLESLQKSLFGQLEVFKQSFLEQIVDWEDQWRVERYTLLDEIVRLSGLLQNSEAVASTGKTTDLDPSVPESDRVTSSHTGEAGKQYVSLEAFEELAQRHKEALDEISRLHGESNAPTGETKLAENSEDLPLGSSNDAEEVISQITTISSEKSAEAELLGKDDQTLGPEAIETHDPSAEVHNPNTTPKGMRGMLYSQIDDSQPSIISPAGSHLYATPTRKRYREGTPTPHSEDDTSDDHSTVFETPHHDTLLDLPQETLSPTERAILGPDYSQLKLQDRAKSFTFDDPLPVQNIVEPSAQQELPPNTIRPASRMAPPPELPLSSSPIGLANIAGISESYDLDNIARYSGSRKRRRYNYEVSSSQQEPPSSSQPEPPEYMERTDGTEAPAPAVNVKTPAKAVLRPPAGIEQDAVLLSSSPSPPFVKIEELSQPAGGLTKAPMAPPKLPLSRAATKGVRNRIGGGNSNGNRAALQPISANSRVLSEPTVESTEAVFADMEPTPGQSDPANFKGAVRQKKALTPTASARKSRIKAPLSSQKAPSSAPAKTVQTTLQLSDFKINRDANSGLDFAYADPVRRKADKACLPGCTSECCAGAFRALAESGLELPRTKNRLRWSSQDSTATAFTNDGDEETRLLSSYLGPTADLASLSSQQRSELLIQAKAEQLSHLYGKHRQQFQRHQTPPGFWRTDMPTTQEAEEDRRLARQLEEKRVAERLREAQRSGGRYVLKGNK